MSSPSEHQSVLDELITLGQDLARQVHAAAGKDLSLEQATIAFDRVSRTVRRTVLLSRRLTADPAHGRTAAARREIIRKVEDAITRADKPALHAELHERLDAPELDDEIGNKPVADIIADIIHDLGLDRLPGTPTPWCRRTPAEIRTLHARAARTRLPLPSGKDRGEGQQPLRHLPGVTRHQPPHPPP